MRCQNGSLHDALQEEKSSYEAVRKTGLDGYAGGGQSSDSAVIERLVYLDIGLELHVVQYALFDQRLSLSIEAVKQTRAGNSGIVADSFELYAGCSKMQ